MKVVYAVGYSDMECYNTLGIFSTRKLAEDYLEPYNEIEKLYGKDYITMFYPSIREIEVDADLPELQFYRTVRRYNDGHYTTRISRAECISLEEDLKNESEVRYNTITLDVDASIEEAKIYFKTIKGE